MEEYLESYKLEGEEVEVIVLLKKDIPTKNALNRAIDLLQWAKCDL